MALNLVLGSSGAGKTYYLCNKMLQDIHERKIDNYIYIVPDQFTLETQKKMVNMHQNIYGRAGIMNIDIASFTRLAFRVFEEQGVNSLSILDDTGKTLILRKVIEEHKGELTIYKDRSRMLGFITEMKSVISELYQYGIDVQGLEDIIGNIKGHNMTKGKLSDILFIYRKFREYVSEMTDKDVQYITKEEVLEELIKLVPVSDLIKNSSIVLDGYTGFTPVQLKLIGLLLEYSKDVTISVTIRTDNLYLTNVGFKEIKEQELFNMSKSTINSLIALANDRQIPVYEPMVISKRDGRHKDNQELDYLEKNVFEYTNAVYDGEVCNVEIYREKNPIDEAKCITDKIFDMMKKDKSLRYRDFAVITGDDSRMLTLSRYFKNANIPHFMDNKKSIIRNPFVETLRSVLEMIDTDFKYESVFRYLRCYMTNLVHEEIDLLENYCLATGIRGKKKYLNEFTRKYKGMSDEELVIVDGSRQTLVEPLIDLMEGLKNASVRQMTTSLYEYIVRMNLKKKLDEYIEKFEDKAEVLLKSEYTQVYKKVMELFDKIVMLMGDEEISLSEYRKILDAGFEEIKVGTIPLVADQLIIGDITRTRLGEIKVLFIMGANDGIIPKHSAAGGLLSQSDRTLLKNISVNLAPTVREDSFIQRFYLYLSLTKPTDKIIITYADCSSDGASSRPSYLIETLLDLYGDGLNVKKNASNTNEMTNKESAFDKLLANIKKYGTDEFDTELLELFAYYSGDSEYKDRLKKAVNGAFFNNRVGSIDSAVARAIYGDDIVYKATRLEKYAACAYAQFMEYGLKLIERKKYELRVADIGTIYHRCIELFTKQLKNYAGTIDKIDDGVRKEIIHNCILKVAEEYNNDVLFATKRNTYILKRCEKVADKTAWAIIEHLKRGKFSPEFMELTVENGRIDRVDTLDLDGTRYIKIIDYKSGQTQFSPMETANGLRIQLMFYMDSLLKRERALNPELRVEPAGVFYFNIQDPLLDYDEKFINEEVYDSEVLKKFTMTGFVNSRQEVFANLDVDVEKTSTNSIVFGYGQKQMNCQMSFATNKGAGSCYNFENFIDEVKKGADDFSEKIVQGDVSLNPYSMNGKKPCTYCLYKDICSFDARNFGNTYRKLPNSNADNLEILSNKFNKEIVSESDNEGEVN